MKDNLEQYTQYHQYKKEQQDKKRRKTILFIRIGAIAMFITSIALLLNELVFSVGRSEISYTTNHIVDELMPPPLSQVEEVVEEDETPSAAIILALREYFENDDIVAFVSIPGTNIAYPILQAHDNDFYLNRDAFGNQDRAGSIFLDYKNSPSFMDFNNIIYGHNMRDGTRFHNLRLYNDFEFFDNHRIIKLITMYDITEWEVFSFFQTNIAFNYIQVEFKDKDEAYTLARDMWQRSRHNTGVQIYPGDRVLTLSTCTNRASDTRYVLSARLIGN